MDRRINVSNIVGDMRNILDWTIVYNFRGVTGYKLW